MLWVMHGWKCELERMESRLRLWLRLAVENMEVVAGVEVRGVGGRGAI